MPEPDYPNDIDDAPQPKQAKEPTQEDIFNARLQYLNELQASVQQDIEVLKDAERRIEEEAKKLPDETDKKKNTVYKVGSWIFLGVMVITFITMLANMVMFFILAGEQGLSLGATLIYFMVIMIIWNFGATFLMIFGFRDAIQNIKMFFGRRAGYGYDILLDRDRGVKKFVVKLNKKILKISGRVYFTNRKKLRLWEGRIPSYVHEAGFLEPSDAGLGDKDTPVDSDEYQTSIELAELAGRLKAKRNDTILIWIGIAQIFFLFIVAGINYQALQNSNLALQFGQATYEIVRNLSTTTAVQVVPVP